MPCACGSNKKTETNKSYVHTSPDGQRRTYKTEVEAVAAQKRLGGTYRSQG